MTTKNPTPQPPPPHSPSQGAGAPARHVVVERTGSTNADLGALAGDPRGGDGWPAGSSLRAIAQTAGRGRAGRSWEAPAGTALTGSVLVRADVPGAAMATLPLVAGLATVGAARVLLGELGGDPAAVGLKWPNDVVADPAGAPELDGWGALRKLGGILVQGVAAASTAPARPAAVVGIGLNIAQGADDLPVPWATSLALLTGGSPGGAVVAHAWDLVRAELAAAVAVWEAAGGDLGPLLGDLRAATASLGRDVRVELAGGGREVRGRAVDIGPDGALLVRTAEGVTAVHAGDVHHVRA